MSSLGQPPRHTASGGTPQQQQARTALSGTTTTEACLKSPTSSLASEHPRDDLGDDSPSRSGGGNPRPRERNSFSRGARGTQDQRLYGNPEAPRIVAQNRMPPFQAFCHQPSTQPSYELPQNLPQTFQKLGSLQKTEHTRKTRSL